jgi:uncharacterized protein YkwD
LFESTPPTATRSRPPAALAPIFRAAFLALAALVMFAAVHTDRAEARSKCRGADTAPAKLSQGKAERLVACVVNRKRSNRGLRRLKWVPTVREAASRHSGTMVRKRCFSHTCRGERDLTGRLSKSRYLPCKCSWSAGEALAIGSGHAASPKSIVRGWMHSPPHRQTMLDPKFRHIGVGFRRGTPYKSSRSSATYTANFGVKR